MSPLLCASRLAAQVSNMNGLSAFVELVKALAWPATLLLLIFFFRHLIVALASSIHEGKIKYGDLELTIKRKLMQAREAIESVQPKLDAPLRTPEETRGPEETELDFLVSVAEIAPRAAIIEAWTRLEHTGAEFVQKHAAPPSQVRRPLRFTDQLLQHHLVPSEVKRAIQKLRDIRNRTVHTPEFEPSVDAAEEYVLLSMAVIEDLRRIT